jgi:hypothetical protein
MPKLIKLTEGQMYKALMPIKEGETSPKSEALVFLNAMNRDLQRANSGNFAHLAANLRGGVQYLIELITENWVEAQPPSDLSP